MFNRISVLAAALLLAGHLTPSVAQTVGYADAIDQLGASCGPDIAKYCKNESLGGGRVRECLLRNQVSARCAGSINALTSLLQKRAAARASVMRVCDVDIKRRCSGIEAGDGNLLECFYKTKQNISPACQQAVAGAGYEVGLASPSTTSGPIKLTSAELVNSLQGVEAAATSISAAQLRQLAAQSIADPARKERVNRAPMFAQLDQLAQFTIAVQFDFNSARIRPDSFRAVGLMADALYSPYLQGYKFLIVGHTDAKGSREYNLKLSQQRADAIRDA